MPKISVCLPVYNGERFLEPAIESVLAQSLVDFELLIADDCSSDGSFAIAQKYAQLDARVRAWKNDQNLGLFANYNNCMSRASGELIKPFAQDDLFARTILERLSQVLAENPQVNLVSSGRRWIDFAGTELKVMRPFSGNFTASGKDVITFNLLKLTNWVGEPSTVMFRRSEVGSGFDTRFYHYGDIEYWFRIVEGGNYFYLDDVLCSFRRHADSASSGNLSGLYFALDTLLLGKIYKHYCEALNESEAHFIRRALEVAAVQVSHLVEQESLTAEGVLAVDRTDRPASPEELAAFKNLSFQALNYLSQLLAERHSLRCTITDLDEMVQDVRKNPWWRATSPLRRLSGIGVEGVDHGLPKRSSGKPCQDVSVYSPAHSAPPAKASS